MSEFQKIALWQQLDGKINAMNEFSLPEIPDGFPAPETANAVGLKNGIAYKWNRIISAWEPMSNDPASVEVEIDDPIDSDVVITKSYMNTTYPGKTKVTFTNLTNYPGNVLIATRIGTDDWYTNLYSNKLI
jgi:hypothetical protein